MPRLLPLMITVCAASIISYGQHPNARESIKSGTQQHASDSSQKSAPGMVTETPYTAAVPPTPPKTADSKQAPIEQKRGSDQLQLILSACNVLVTSGLGYMVYRLNRKVRGESHLEYFRTIHKEFWENEEMKRV